MVLYIYNSNLLRSAQFSPVSAYAGNTKECGRFLDFLPAEKKSACGIIFTAGIEVNWQVIVSLDL